MQNSKIILIYSRTFYPDNSGFSNAALDLVKCISELPEYKLVVMTNTYSIKNNNFPLNGVEVLRTWEDGNAISRFIGNKIVRSLLVKFKLGWFLYWYEEYLQFCITKKYLEDENLTLVIFETNQYPFLGNWVLNLVPSKVVIRFHAAADTEEFVYGGVKKSHFFKYLFNTIMKKKITLFCKRAKNIIATNSFYLDFFKEKIMNDNPYSIWDKFYYGVLPNTVSLDSLYSDKSYKDKFNLPDKFCLTLGRLDEAGWLQKGFADIITSVGELHCKGCLPSDFHLVIIGNGDYINKLEKMINNYDISSYITHIISTTREETSFIIQNSSYIVSASRFEGQSMFLTEALALGSPIITTNGTGASDMVEDGQNGFLFEIGDTVALSKNLVKMQSMSNIDLLKFSEKSKKIFNERFSHEFIKTQFAKLIKSVNINN